MFYAHSHVGPALVANHAKILRRFNHFAELNAAWPTTYVHTLHFQIIVLFLYSKFFHLVAELMVMLTIKL